LISPSEGKEASCKYDQYRIEVGKQEFFIDLLFYHIKLPTVKQLEEEMETASIEVGK